MSNGRDFESEHEQREWDIQAVEVWLERGLLALLLLGGAAALLAYRDSLPEVFFSVPAGAAAGIQSLLGWSFAVAACIGLSSAVAFFGKR